MKRSPDRFGSLPREQLITIIDAIAACGPKVLALEIVLSRLKEGRSVEGRGVGCHLSVSRSSPDSFYVSVGCSAGPLAGDGGSWLVAFDGKKVESVTLQGFWIA